MNVEDKAHEYAKILLNHTMSEHGRLSVEDAFNIAETAHILADAMLEVQGKKPVTHPAVLEDWQPDWSLAPNDAVACAMDADKSMWWHEKDPNRTDVEWIGDVLGEYKDHGYVGDWRDSFRKRPERV